LPTINNTATHAAAASR